MASLLSTSEALPSGISDVGTDDSFETAPTSATNRSLASSPEIFFPALSSPAPKPIIKPPDTPETPRAKKNLQVTWSSLPPTMDRTPKHSTSSPELGAREGPSLPWRTRTPTAPQNVSPLTTPTQVRRGRSNTSQSPIQAGRGRGNASQSPTQPGRCGRSASQFPTQAEREWRSAIKAHPQAESDKRGASESPTQAGRGQGGASQAPLRRSADQVLRYEPLPGNPLLPLDICADDFLKSKKFEIICNVAMSIACMIPTDPPPTSFVSLNATPMHPWFESLIAVFTEIFAKRLRERNTFPKVLVASETGGIVTMQEDHVAFESELVAHVNAIFRSFNTNWAVRQFGSYDNLFVDTTQPNAGIAAVVIKEVTTKASFPPKANWKVGETLHPFYYAQLRRFRGGVVRMIGERVECAWLLTVPEQLERGIAGYEQYYIAHVRHKILVHNGEA